MKEREKRQTAGKRMNALVGEEADKDSQFWGHETWEEGEESEFSDTDASSDEFDTDFNESESEEEEGEDEEAEKRLKAREKKQAKTTGVYREPKSGPRPALTPEEVEEAKAKKAEAKKKAAEALMIVERSKRQSTVKKSEAIQKSLQRQESAQARAQVSYATKPRPTKCIFTQEGMLQEACQTEHENARWLLARKRLMNESDAVTAAPKRQIPLSSRFYSRRGRPTVVHFPEVDSMPEILDRVDPPVPVKGVVECVITGEPAKYKDPLTGLPYATIEAFKQIRASSARKSGMDVARQSGRN